MSRTRPGDIKSLIDTNEVQSMMRLIELYMKMKTSRGSQLRDLTKIIMPVRGEIDEAEKAIREIQKRKEHVDNSGDGNSRQRRPMRSKPQRCNGLKERLSVTSLKLTWTPQ